MVGRWRRVVNPLAKLLASVRVHFSPVAGGGRADESNLFRAHLEPATKVNRNPGHQLRTADCVATAGR
jgi:hypothetical protein